MLTSKTLDESESFERIVRDTKVKRAPKVEERGEQRSGRENLPRDIPCDVWLTAYMLSSPEPLTSLFTLLRGSSPFSFFPSIIWERGNLRRARLKWLQAATCSKGRGGHGETKAIQVIYSELAWDSQAPSPDNTESTSNLMCCHFRACNSDYI